jgi:hypothetical protein
VNGKVQIFSEGRYAINSGTFAIAGFINTQQCTLRFEKHPVLLDGGISLLVEGLLTFQCTDVETLIHQLGDVDLVRSIKDVTKAELARVVRESADRVCVLHVLRCSACSRAHPTRFGSSLLIFALWCAVCDDPPGGDFERDLCPAGRREL